ncbi:MAG: hypothetical protein NTV40_04955 [Solirubrobacterales bacterium]|nr:hypothetical protein [Solirubrobacterales bacterium]
MSEDRDETPDGEETAEHPAPPLWPASPPASGPPLEPFVVEPEPVVVEPEPVVVEPEPVVVEPEPVVVEPEPVVVEPEPVVVVGSGEERAGHPVRYFLIGALLGIVALAAIFGVGLLLLHDSNSASTAPRAQTLTVTTPAKAPTVTETTPTKAPADLSPQMADAKLTTVALGPIKVGMTLEEATAEAGTKLDTELSTGDESCRSYTPAGGPQGARILISSGIVTGFAVNRNTVPTFSGIVVGDSAEKVRSIYGERIQVSPGDGGETLTYVPSDSADKTRIVFETDSNATVVAMRAGRSSGAGGIANCG